MLVRVLASTIVVSALLVQPAAPEVLRPGDSKIQAATLRPYKVRWKETLVNVINQVIERGTWDDQLVRESHNGREVLRRTIVITEPGGSVRERYEVLVDARHRGERTPARDQCVIAA